MMETLREIPKQAIVIAVSLVLTGLAVIVAMSLLLAAQERDSLKRQCMSRNDGREDIKDVLLDMLDGVDPSHRSILFVDEPPSEEYPNGRRNISSRIHEQLTPVPCP
jgi:hypothetical protein